MTTPILATLFDFSYAAKGLALIRSLQRWHADFRLFVLALDDASYSAVSGLNDNRIMCDTLENYIRRTPIASADLQRALVGRTTAEVCYTLTPYFTRLAMKTIPHVPHITYVDADSWLTAPLDPFYAEIGDASVSIIPHRFPPRMAWREKENGVYNVNLVHFKNDATGRACLDEWAEQCLKWCYNRTEHAKDGTLLYADQAYLDAFPKKYNAHVIQNIALSLAPWNQEQYDYTFDNGALYVIATNTSRVTAIEKVRVYHFHGLLESFNDPRHPEIKRGGHPLKPEIIEHLYLPYEKELAEIHATLNRNR